MSHRYMLLERGQAPPSQQSSPLNEYLEQLGNFRVEDHSIWRWARRHCARRLADYYQRNGLLEGLALVTRSVTAQDLCHAPHSDRPVKDEIDQYNGCVEKAVKEAHGSRAKVD